MDTNGLLREELEGCSAGWGGRSSCRRRQDLAELEKEVSQPVLWGPPLAEGPSIPADPLMVAGAHMVGRMVAPVVSPALTPENCGEKGGPQGR